METPPAPGSVPPPSPIRTTPRWGVPDVALAWVAGLIGAVVAGAVAVAVTGVAEDDVTGHGGVFLASLAGQNGVTILVLGLVARRKGLGSLRKDFGLVVRARDLGWVGAGAGLQIGLGILLLPILEVYGRDESQTVVDVLDDAGGAEYVLFALAVVTLAPLTEELLFRGVLLRALLRRTTPSWAVFASALVFALVHPLGDPAIGSIIVVPALLALGVASGWLAVRSGDLSRSILLHAGFNLLTALAVLA